MGAFFYFLFPFLLINPISESNINGTYKVWTSGVCCKTGIEYELNLVVKKSKASHVKFESACLDKHLLTKLKTSIRDSANYSIVTVKCSYEKDVQNKPYSTNNGLSPAPLFDSCTTNTLQYLYKKKTFTVLLPELSRISELPRP